MVHSYCLGSRSGRHAASMGYTDKKIKQGEKLREREIREKRRKEIHDMTRQHWITPDYKSKRFVRRLYV